ENDYLGWMDF
nr:caerulein,2-Asn,5-Leu [Kassina cochranae]